MCGTERWGDCPGYEGLYRVSDRGRVFNVVRGTHLQGRVTRQGYREVKLSRDRGRVRSYLVHALVLKTFVGPRPQGFVCDHLSGNKLDNELSNLEWVTPRENARRAALAGRLRPKPCRGSKHYRSKFTDDQVRDIRRRHQCGKAVRDLAREHGVHIDTIRKIVTRLSWAHIE